MNRRGGFLCLETLAGIAILSLLIASILPLADSLARAHRDSIDLVFEEAALGRALAILREDLRDSRGRLDRVATFERDARTLILDRPEGPVIWRAEEDRLLRIDPREEGEGRSFLVAVEELRFERLGDGRLLRVKIVRAIGRGSAPRPACATVAPAGGEGAKGGRP